MLELPESTVVAQQLNQAVAGKAITRAEANHSPHGFAFYFGDPAGYDGLLAGKTIQRAQAVAGQIELTCGQAKILLNDGVSPRYFGPGEKRPAKHQLLLELEDGGAVTCTVQMYGGMMAFLDGQYDSMYYRVAREKPSPLTEDFDRAYFEGLLRACKPTLSAKAFLATEQRIPGLGNGVLQDILWQAGVHPKAKLAGLDSAATGRLFDSVKGVLSQMVRLGGRDTEKDLYGAWGGYQTVLSKKTYARPCPQCGGPIVRQAYLGGNVYFCPACQKQEPEKSQ